MVRVVRISKKEGKGKADLQGDNTQSATREKPGYLHSTL